MRYRFQRNDASAHVFGLTDESEVWRRHFAKADMVIEAVPENLDLKHKVASKCLLLLLFVPLSL